MNPKRLWQSAGVLLALLVGFNMALHNAARHTQRGSLLTRLQQIPLDTECLFVGNSLIEAGCDLQAFAGGWKHAPVSGKLVNLALGGTSPVEHYLILRQAYQRPIHPRLIIYGFMDDQLNSESRGQLADLTGNRAFSYYFPARAAELYAPGSWFRTLQLQLVAHVPMLAERSTLWVKVEGLRRRMAELGFPRQRFDRFGRMADFAALEAKDSGSFEERCRQLLKSQASFSPAIRRIIDLAREHGAECVFVEMPMPSHHQKLFYSCPGWRDMRTWLQALCGQQGVRYISASDWVQRDEGFEDLLHLNQHGARMFSTRLGQELCRPADVPERAPPAEKSSPASAFAAPIKHPSAAEALQSSPN